MERKLKILKAVLLLRRVNRSRPKEEQMEQAEKWYSDEQLDLWIDALKHPSPATEGEEEELDFPEPEDEFGSSDKYYSPSNPWDAPGMSIRDFI